jgi:AraC family transcriptional regulator, regulatory protein of adaptative response / DNA-3-methyladenine glycosylase II
METLTLPYVAPFDWPGMLRFLKPRCVAGVEAIVDDSYVRAARHGEYVGWLRVRHDGPELSVELHGLPAQEAVPRVRRLLDLDTDPAPILERLGPLAAGAPGLRVPGSYDPFEMAIRAILGQQISVAAAHTIAGRIARDFGTPLSDSPLQRVFPEPAHLADLPPDELKRLGIPLARVAAIQGLARAVLADPELLEPGPDPEAQILRLQSLPGIGPWTAHYFAMRALRWSDAFPHGDLGIKKALGVSKPADVLQAAEKWRPWRAYATLHLWRSLAL